MQTRVIDVADKHVLFYLFYDAVSTEDNTAVNVKIISE
jgi:hypothetical protein